MTYPGTTQNYPLMMHTNSGSSVPFDRQRLPASQSFSSSTTLMAHYNDMVLLQASYSGVNAAYRKHFLLTGQGVATQSLYIGEVSAIEPSSIGGNKAGLSYNFGLCSGGVVTPVFAPDPEYNKDFGYIANNISAVAIHLKD